MVVKAQVRNLLPAGHFPGVRRAPTFYWFHVFCKVGSRFTGMGTNRIVIASAQDIRVSDSEYTVALRYFPTYSHLTRDSCSQVT